VGLWRAGKRLGAKSVSLASLVGRRSAGGGSGEVQIEETEYESEKEVNASLVPAARYLLLDARAIFKQSLRPEGTLELFRAVVAVRLLRL
jgi:hypothetical protein